MTRFQCRLCYQNSASLSSFKIHVSAVHLKIKPFACTFCEFRTARKTCLNVHLIKHMSNRSFICPKCDYTCPDREDLEEHFKIHPRVQREECCETKMITSEQALQFLWQPELQLGQLERLETEPKIEAKQHFKTEPCERPWTQGIEDANLDHKSELQRMLPSIPSLKTHKKTFDHIKQSLLANYDETITIIQRSVNEISEQLVEQQKFLERRAEEIVNDQMALLLIEKNASEIVDANRRKYVNTLERFVDTLGSCDEMTTFIDERIERLNKLFICKETDLEYNTIGFHDSASSTLIDKLRNLGKVECSLNLGH